MSKELLKEFILQELATPQLTAREPDIWDSTYSYSSADGPQALAKSALKHFGQMMGQGAKSPADPKFLNAVAKRLQYIGVPPNDISIVLGKLRMSK